MTITDPHPPSVQSSRRADAAYLPVWRFESRADRRWIRCCGAPTARVHDGGQGVGRPFSGLSGNLEPRWSL